MTPDLSIINAIFRRAGNVPWVIHGMVKQKQNRWNYSCLHTARTRRLKTSLTRFTTPIVQLWRRVRLVYIVYTNCGIPSMHRLARRSLSNDASSRLGELQCTDRIRRTGGGGEVLVPRRESTFCFVADQVLCCMHPPAQSVQVNAANMITTIMIATFPLLFCISIFYVLLCSLFLL